MDKSNSFPRYLSSPIDRTIDGFEMLSGNGPRENTQASGEKLSCSSV